MSLKQASLAVMLAGMWALGCSGSPTSSSGFQLVLTVSVANTAMKATITETVLFLVSVLLTEYQTEGLAGLTCTQ